MATSMVHIMYLMAISHVILSKNKKNEAMYWAMYLVSFEVLFRMSEGLIFYESVKYIVIFLLLLGLLIESKKHAIPVIYIIYLLLLSIGIAFSNIPEGESIRKAVAFNLGGPILVGVSAIYFYHRRISKTEFIKLLRIGSFPLLAILSFLFMKTPNLSDLVFTTQANFVTSGSFGPNQVATILGFGMFAVAALIIVRKRLTGFLGLDVLILVYITYRGLLTFSRGGVLTGVIAIFILSVFYILSQRYVLYNLLKYFTLAFFIGIGLWIYTSGVTGGMLDNRYSGKNTAGVQKEDITSGRTDILKTDLQFFYENPIFGIGVGGGKYKRMEEKEIDAASHNEIGRLLSEHGLIGLFSLFILMTIPILHFLQVDNFNKGFLLAFFIFWFLTINHSAMRLSFPGFVYGLTLLTIISIKDE